MSTTKTIGRWIYRTILVVGLLLHLRAGLVTSCNPRDLDPCDERYKLDSDSYRSLIKQRNYTYTERFVMICRIVTRYANCTYPKVDGCHRSMVSSIDAFFAKYSACRIAPGADWNITILPDPTVPPERAKGTCDTKAVGVCIAENSGIIKELFAKFKAGGYNSSHRIALICREGERLSVCLYSKSMGCTDPYLARVDAVVAKYNVAQFACGIPLYPHRDLNGHVKTNETTVPPQSTSTVTGTSTSTNSSENVTTNVPTNAVANATTDSPSTSPPVTTGTPGCKLHLLVACDKQFKADSNAFARTVEKSNMTQVEKVERICKIVGDYAKCTYPKIDTCYKKTIDYVDHFFATKYGLCRVPKASARGITFVPNPTVPPEREKGTCNTTAVNACMTANRDNLYRILEHFQDNNYTLQAEDRILCAAIRQFAGCAYSQSMGCTNDYLGRVSGVVANYSRIAYNCSVPGYRHRSLNGAVQSGATSAPTPPPGHRTNATSAEPTSPKPTTTKAKKKKVPTATLR